MKKIQFLSETGDLLGDIAINGITISEIQTFLESIDNESFEYFSLYYDEESKILCIEEERGVIFPQYGHFISKISDSKYRHCFDFV
ncbi:MULTISPECIES: PH domain-containing protein [Chryseobacterium]|uniref:Uncharacterized protein n=1 Tax=Chryseobacterium caseinilyticum TaxID=2771428 RepID=A0ABR8Z8H4_9FLAO|nr:MULTISPECIES: hypothetical protein [Chryseobacterium]KQS92450.1 hypothetical protein ASG21_08410 [Chryseobacterium sp. Leaf394]MBD8081528.1 hypothetical protein [Chryseobacterium caseinilyticum]